MRSIDRGEDQRHRLTGHRHAVAEFAHQGLSRVRQRFQSRQPERKPHVPLMVWTRRKMLSKIFALFRILLETHQLIVDGCRGSRSSPSRIPANRSVHESTFREFGGYVAADFRSPRTETDRWIASLRAGSRWRTANGILSPSSIAAPVCLSR